MPLYRNDKDRIDMESVRDYSGTDEYMVQLHKAYAELHTRYFKENRDALITIMHPKISAGRKGSKDNKPRRAQESWPFVGTVQTDLGGERLRYCKSAIQLTGGLWKFEPANFVMNTRTIRLGIKDIDMLIFLIVAFGPMKRGEIFMVDEQADAEKKSIERERSVHVGYHIFDKSGDLYGDKDKLIKFCQAWGIPVINKHAAQLKNELADKIEASEKARDFDYGYEAFRKALSEHDSTFTIKVLMQNALEQGLIKYYPKVYAIQFKNFENFLKVPPQNSDQWKKYAVDFMAANPAKTEELRALVDGVPMKEAERQIAKLNVMIPDAPTREYFEGLDFHTQLRPLYAKVADINPEEFRMITKKTALTFCIDFFITQGKKLPG